MRLRASSNCGWAVWTQWYEAFLYITRFAGSVYSNPINPLKDWGTQTRSSIKFVISPLQPEGVSLACGNSEFKPSPFLRYLFLLRFFFHWPIQLHFQNRKQSHLPLLPVLTPVFLIMTSSRHCRYSTWWYTVCLKMHLLMNTWIIPLLFLHFRSYGCVKLFKDASTNEYMNNPPSLFILFYHRNIVNTIIKKRCFLSENYWKFYVLYIY